MSNYRNSSSQDGSRSYRGGGNGGGYRGGSGGGGGYRGKSRGRGGGGGYGGNQSRGGGSKYRGRGGSSYYKSKDDYGVDPRSRLNDDDIAMDGDEGMLTSSRARYNPYGARPNNRGGRGKMAMDGPSQGAMKRLGLPYNSRGGGGFRGSSSRGGGSRGGGSSGRIDNNYSQSGWYQVTIPHGRKQQKDWLIKKLNEFCNLPVVPVHFHHAGNNAIFFVNDKDTAEALRRVSRQITDASGYKVLVLTRPSGPPAVSHMDDATLEKLKVCMSKRYDPITKALNISNLYNDPDLNKEGIQLALSRNYVMESVVKIIIEHIPELTSLDLSDNRLYQLGDMEPLVSKVTGLVKLSLENNQLKYDKLLSFVQKLPLEELCLDGNPLCDNYQDEKSYISAIRKRFPKVMKLDGHFLPAPIKFAIEDTVALPPSKGSYFLSEQAQPIIIKFLEQYFQIFDNDNRQPLLNAYHDQAIFSFNVGFSTLLKKQPGFMEILPDSRNLRKIGDNARREKNLKVGRLNVVAQLSSMPQTKHDLNSFVVDVMHASAQMLSFSVFGLYKERNRGESGPVRAFSRVFVTVPQGGGIAIVNDQLSITNATKDQQEKAFKTPVPTPSSSPVLPPGGVVASPAGSLPGTPGTPGTAPGTPADTQKIQMVQQFSVQSGMNLSWSEKCLIQNGWDYNKSAQIFTDLHSQGKIPPDAFVK